MNNKTTIKKITEDYPMNKLEKHSFFFIRFINALRIKLLINIIGNVNNKIIADIGCEAGGILSKILKKQRPKKVIGVDLSFYALNKAKIRAINEKWKIKPQLIVADAENIKLKDCISDITISSNVLEHLDNPQKGFDELIRITKKGGKIILHLPNEKTIIKIKKFIYLINPKLLGYLKIITPGHKHFPDKKFILNLIKNSPHKLKILKFRKGPNVSLPRLYFYLIIKKE